jgi:hypothetical protein
MSQGGTGNPNPNPETRIGQPLGPKARPPFGNQNAAKPFKWRRAIDAALEDWAKNKKLPSAEVALMKLAGELLKAVARGDMAAVRELGDRLDGKPKQVVEHEGNVGIAIYKPDADDAELG